MASAHPVSVAAFAPCVTVALAPDLDTLREAGERLGRARAWLAESGETKWGSDSVKGAWGIDGNTFRATSTKAHGVRPSMIVRRWQAQRFPALGAHEEHGRLAVRLDSPHGFAAWRSELVDSLGAAWSEAIGQASEAPVLSLAHCNKLVDLSVKAYARGVPRDVEPSARLKARLIAHASLALDKFTLSFLAKVYPGLPLPESPSMGLIRTPEAYALCQHLAREAAGQIGATPLELDVVLWHLSGPRLDD